MNLVRKKRRIMIKTEHRKKKQKKTAIPEKKNIVPRIRAS